MVYSLTLVLAGTIVACNGEKNKKGKDESQYQTMVVSKKDMTLTQQYSARLTGRQIVEIRPQVTGNITRICTSEGKPVKRGQTLFIIDQTPYQAALEVAVANRRSAEAKLSTARMNYDHYSLFTSKEVSSEASLRSPSDNMARSMPHLQSDCSAIASRPMAASILPEARCSQSGGHWGD